MTASQGWNDAPSKVIWYPEAGLGIIQRIPLDSTAQVFQGAPQDWVRCLSRVHWGFKNYRSQELCIHWVLDLEREAAAWPAHESLGKIVGCTTNNIDCPLETRASHQTVANLRCLSLLHSTPIGAFQMIQTQGKHIVLLLSWRYACCSRCLLSDVSIVLGPKKICFSPDALGEDYLVLFRLRELLRQSIYILELKCGVSMKAICSALCVRTPHHQLRCYGFSLSCYLVSGNCKPPYNLCFYLHRVAWIVVDSIIFVVIYYVD